MDREKTKKNKAVIRKVLAWIGMIVITVLLCILAYAMLTGNKELTMKMFMLVFIVSVIIWLGVRRDKRNQMIEEYFDKEAKQNFNDTAHQNTKNL